MSIKQKMRCILYGIFILIFCGTNSTYAETIESFQNSDVLGWSSTQQAMINCLYGGSGGKISCDFDGYQTTSGRHEGIDFTKTRGATVYSLTSGTVIRANNPSSGLSTLAIYDAANNKSVIYLHASGYKVSTGQSVSQGQAIAVEASKGASAAHTHVEVRNGKHGYASKSVNDPVLNNENPYPYWDLIFRGDQCNCSDSYAGDYVCTSATTLKIRSGHGTSYGTIGSIPHGATVYVSKADGSWAHVSYNGINGYVSMDYLQKKPVTYDPQGYIDSIEGGKGSIHLRGWAFDRDALDQAVGIHVYVGGPAGQAAWSDGSGVANVERPGVNKVYGVGNYHGYDYTLNVPLTGEYDVYVYAINIGGGKNVLLGTKHVTIQPVTYDPQGYIDSIEGGKGSIHLRGWAFDRDALDQAVGIHVYVGGPAGQAAWSDGSGIANVERPGVNKVYGVGDYHGYDYTLKVPLTGEYDVYVYAINIGGGENVLLGTKHVTIEPEAYDPHGYIDSIKGGEGSIHLRGWAFDRDALDQPVEIHVYVGGPKGQAIWSDKSGIANVERPGVNKVYGVGDYHGYDYTLKVPLTGEYDVYVYAINIGGGEDVLLGSKQVTIESQKISVADMSGVVIGGRAKDALRVNWNKNTSASGYILEQYNNGSWNRIARIEGNATTTYRVEKLKSDTTYQFRIKGFTFDGSTAVYGNYQTVSGKTDAVSLNLDSLNGVKIGGRADNALRINWNKNADASGYIIEQYSNGSWNRIVKIGNGSTTTYRVENLKAGTKYQFRIKTFGYKGTEAVYGKYVSISGKTNPASVSGLKIGGTAKDALRLNWNTASGAEGYIIEKYESNTWKRIARLEGGKTATYRAEGLKAGTSYRFRMKAFGFDGSTAIYSEYKEITGKTDAASTSTVTVGVMTGVKIGGRADNALRLNWDKNTSAAGYIIEQNQNGTWTRIAKIGQNTTTTYRVEKLSAGRTYQFRIQGFGFQGSTPVYGNFTYVNGTTIPSKVSGLCIGGTAADALRLNWNKNTNASGYIIEKLQNGAWVRVARIADKNTQTYRVEGLQSKKSYVFRICAFGFDGGTPLYSDYQMITGNTK